MSVKPPIIVISNDVVPGMGMSVGAPGLRSHGLAVGLEAHGFDVTQVVMRGPVKRRWWSRVAPPSQPGVDVLYASELGSYLNTRAPAVVVAINSNQIDHIPDNENLGLIVDLFAPRVLEVACQSDIYPVEEIRQMRRRNHKAFEMADSFIVNGAKKMPFYLGWLMQVDRDPRSVDFAVVPMTMVKAPELKQTVDASFPGGHASGRGLRVATAGYLQGWSKPGPWFSTICERLAAAGAEFNVLMVPRLRDGDGVEEIDLSVFDHPAITRRSEMLFDEYQSFMVGMDFAIDLFDHSIEREYAMVTRTVGAIACGLPVIHPPWSETGALINSYDAGWLVDPADTSALVAAIDEATSDHEGRRKKAANALRLWEEVFNPVVSVKPLVAQIESIAARF